MNHQNAGSGSGKQVGRRELFRGAATLVGGAAACALLPDAPGTEMRAAAAQAPAAAGSSSPIVIASSSGAVVETNSGKVRGYVRNGISAFKGIPYGAPTDGNARFMPPAKPKPWTGVRSSMYYGPVSPQEPRGSWAQDDYAFMFEWDDGQPGEDCLRINCWTPGINDNKKRPVMVWIHGGRFSTGSGQELKAYDGENLARRGDVVVVSLNHRLNVLGYLNLAAYGERYASSGNVGMLDLVAALEWVRDNIGNFGGDPGNVTVFGQSGGGRKVSTLLGMPAAKGLFHRAIVQSGSALRQLEPDASAKVAAGFLAELGLTGAQVERLHQMPAEQLMKAQVQALRNVQLPAAALAGGATAWGPTVDGKILPQHQFHPGASSISAHVPLMTGTVLNEQMNPLFRPELESLTAAELKTRLTQTYGDKADRIIETFRRGHPNARPVDLFSLISAVTAYRQNAVTMAGRKAALKAAPAYLYWFQWKTPILDGRPGVTHCAELPFCFYNTDRCATMTGGTAEARALSAKVADAWINFARTGDPNHSGLPKWPVFSAEQVPTMILDNQCELKNDPDRDERQILREA